MRLLAAVTAFLVLTACGGSNDGDTGRVSGTVTADVCAGSEGCEPQAVVGAPIEMRHSTDATVEPRRTITDSEGGYRFDVEPGAWIVSAGPIPGLDGIPAEVPVEVAKGSNATVPLVYTTDA